MFDLKPAAEQKPAFLAMIILCSIFAYLLLFVGVLHTAGNGMSMCVIVPVFMVSWFLGLFPGLCAGFLSLPLNILAYLLFSLNWRDMVVHGGGIIGTINVIVIGAIVGWLRDLNIQSRQQRDELNTKTTQLQSALADLSETKNQLINLIQISLDPILICSSAGRVVGANKPFQEMLGYSKEEITNKIVWDLTPMHDGVYESTTGEQLRIGQDFRDESMVKVAQMFETNKVSDWHSYYQRKDGKIVPIVQNIVFLHNDNGEQSDNIATIRDITDQRKAELELIRAKEAAEAAKEVAEAANESKSLFLANMSHEIRTPMNGVVGFADMLLETKLDPEQREYLNTIKQSSEVLLSLINDILDFSKIEAGKIDLDTVAFDLEVLAYSVCELIHPRLTGKNIAVVCHIADTLPSLVVADPNRLRQVLLNLLSNAVKFTPAGSIELSVAIDEERDGNFLMHARVSDTGIGIAADKLEMIFNTFQQADSSTTRQYGGTGLGLAICRKIARLMGGEIWAESPAQFTTRTPALGAATPGSTFHFTAWVQKAEEKAGAHIAPVSLAGKRILVADGSAQDLTMLTNIIHACHLDAAGFTSGRVALQALADADAVGQPFAVCIIDDTLADMPGFDLAHQIRGVYGSRIPLIANSATAVYGAKKYKQEGFDGFLPKPVNRVKLLHMIELLLGEEKEPDVQHEIVTQHSMRDQAKHAASILLVEDNIVNQNLAYQLLTKGGYKVTVAGNGRQAVELFSADPGRYSIIFMDVQMPVLNGFDATREIRQFEAGRLQAAMPQLREACSTRNPNATPGCIPIVAMTANAIKGDREKCLAAGMSDYLPKPIRREAVFAMLEKWVFAAPDRGPACAAQPQHIKSPAP